MLYRTGLVFLSLLLAGAADAQERNCSLQPPDADVRPRHYAVDLSDNPSLLAGPRTPGCPNASPACIAPGYELMAVAVMGLYTRGDYACVIYVRPNDPWGLPYRSGYLPLSILTPIPAGEITGPGHGPHNIRRPASPCRRPPMGRSTSKALPPTSKRPPAMSPRRSIARTSSPKMCCRAKPRWPSSRPPGTLPRPIRVTARPARADMARRRLPAGGGQSLLRRARCDLHRLLHQAVTAALPIRARSASCG